MAYPNLYLDEMIPLDLALVLRQYGYNVLTAKDAGMLGKNDKEQLEFSVSYGRTILTFNISDFVRLHHHWLQAGKKHKGIVVSPEIKISALVKLCLKFLATINEGEIDNQIRYLQEFLPK